MNENMNINSAVKSEPNGDSDVLKSYYFRSRQEDESTKRPEDESQELQKEESAINKKNTKIRIKEKKIAIK